MTASGEWSARRLHQVREGLFDFAREKVLTGMARSPAVRAGLDGHGLAVAEGTMTLRAGADEIAEGFLAEARHGSSGMGA
jgi:hypothetical protein